MKTRARVLVLLLFGVIVIAAAAFFPLNSWLHHFLDWVRVLGPLGMVVYAFVYVLGTVLLIPGTALTLGSGFLFGVAWGTILVSLASVTGASLAFLIARTFGREWTRKRIERYPKFKLIDNAIGNSGFKLVLLMRLDPVFLPFAVLNYALGLTRVRFRDYVVASWIGMLPASALYVYLGSSAKNLSDLLQGKVASAGPWPQVLFWAGLIAAAALVFILTRIAHQALRAKIEPEAVSQAQGDH